MIECKETDWFYVACGLKVIDGVMVWRPYRVYDDGNDFFIVLYFNECSQVTRNPFKYNGGSDMKPMLRHDYICDLVVDEGRILSNWMILNGKILGDM